MFLIEDGVLTIDNWVLVVVISPAGVRFESFPLSVVSPVLLLQSEHDPVIAMHTTDPSCATLRHVLAHTEVIPWGHPTLLFESVHERCLPVLVESLRARGDPEKPPAVYPTDKMVLPREEALLLDTR